MKCHSHPKHKAIYCVVCATNAGMAACEAHERLTAKLAEANAVIAEFLFAHSADHVNCQCTVCVKLALYRKGQADEWPVTVDPVCCRELETLRQGLSHIGFKKLQTNLAAAEKVVEQAELVTKYGLFDVRPTDFIELRHRCEEYKLQGGE